jgi:hypothetical protein
MLLVRVDRSRRGFDLPLRFSIRRGMVAMRAPNVSRRFRWMFVLGGLVVAVALGGVAWATIPDENGVFSGCYARDGYLRVVEPGVACKKGEHPVSWNELGQPGVPGQQGEQGRPGEQGQQGERGPSDTYAASDGTVPLNASYGTVLSRDVPQGSYAVTAAVNVFTGTYTVGPRYVSCTLFDTFDQAADNATVFIQTPAGGPNGAAALTLVGAVRTSPFQGGTLRIACFASGYVPGDYIGGVGRLIATRVGSVHLPGEPQ